MIAHADCATPFVRMDLAWWQFQAIKFLVRLWGLPTILATLCRLLPRGFFAWALRVFAGITAPHALDVVCSFVRSGRLLQQSAYFAQTEFRDVLRPPTTTAGASAAGTKREGALLPLSTAPSSGPSVSPAAPLSFDPSFLSAHVREATLLYADGSSGEDIWGPRSQMRDLQRLVPSLRAHSLPGIEHAWCAHKDQSECMADVVATKIQQDVERVEPLRTLSQSAPPHPAPALVSRL
jgi:hypothetical protein